jgi:Fic family protein
MTNISTVRFITEIKSCVFHYDMEFIHPFTDGNGRTSRLWHTLILMQNQPVFEFLPFETLISENQKTYYNALAASDKAGKAAPFITYTPGVINDSLSQLLNYNNRTLTDLDCLE